LWEGLGKWCRVSNLKDPVTFPNLGIPGFPNQGINSWGTEEEKTVASVKKLLQAWGHFVLIKQALCGGL